MHGMRDELFSCAALSIDKDAAIGGGDGDLLPQRFHGDAVTDDLIAMAQLAAQSLIFFFETALLDGVTRREE